MSDLGYLRQLLAGARFREMLIETKRIEIEGADPRTIATGQNLGTPGSARIAKRGVSLDLAIQMVADALATARSDPYSGYAQAVIVQARAI